ncbi:MAG TPA: DUF2267 domain-containing protein [Solirubrobacteraceae bacterium]|jgi:uncharacterized protein (DUF2267 family)
MTVASAHSVERSVHKTNEWLKDLEAELGVEDRDDAWRMLRGYLHVLRDRLTIDEAAQLAAQLTHLIRGVFYEGFDPGHQPERIRDADVFLARLGEAAELPDAQQAARAAVACTHVLAKHITSGEFDDVLSQLPSEIRSVLTGS